MPLWPAALAVLGLVAAAAAVPTLPLHTSGAWIYDAGNERVKLRCVNWAGHMEVNLPEGLHAQPLAVLADSVRDLGFNCVRLTYSIDHALRPDVRVADAFVEAAAAAQVPVANMTALYAAAVAANPFLGGANTTTRDVFGAVVDALWARGVMTLLDNHVSRASWCCDLTDGNGWWDTAYGYLAANSRFFHTDEWLRGLQAMAAWAAADHPGVVALSLRNELRPILLQNTNGGADWFALIGEAAARVHAAHPDALVVVGGTAGATDLALLLELDHPLNTSAWAGKHVWEWHTYSFTVTFPHILPCSTLHGLYDTLDGFVRRPNTTHTAPLLLSEFGAGQTGGPADGLSAVERTYLSCLVDYMETTDADWALWALQGSYYVRDGQTNYDESYGLLDYTWSGLRNPLFPGMLGGMWNMTQS